MVNNLNASLNGPYASFSDRSVEADRSKKQEDQNAVNEKLENFRATHCPDVHPDEMKKMIVRGRDIENELFMLQQSNNWPSSSAEEKKEKLRKIGLSKIDIVSFMWRLTEKAAEKGDLFTSGVTRISNGEVVRDYLNECEDDEENKLAYNRTKTTHFKELRGPAQNTADTRIKGDNPQRGLDLKNEKLPANKHTILYGLLSDGSVFIKMEEKGMPPLGSWAAVKENLGHAKTWLKTRPAKFKLGVAKFFGMEIPDEKDVRKEHVSSSIQKAFKKAMQERYPPKRFSISRILHGMSKEGVELYKNGTKYGISKMQEILNASKLIVSTNSEHKFSQKMPTEMSETNKKIEGVLSTIDESYFAQGGKVKGNEFCTTLARK